MGKIANITFAQMPSDSLEFIVDRDFRLPKRRKFQVISQQDATELYFSSDSERVPVYVVVGAQMGDEGKAKSTKIVKDSDPRIRWTIAPNSTHNAGKGIDTVNDLGERVRFSLHITPGTIIDRDMSNYISKNCQVNPFILRREVEDTKKHLGREVLGVDYHLMVDRLANLMVPTNRADDIVNKKNANGSTMSGATSSLKYASAKSAPLVEHVLYDHTRFKKLVDKQILDFNDNLRRDSELEELGITDMKSFGLALKDESVLRKNKRLSALSRKISEAEVEFFCHENPAEYLLDQYLGVFNSDLFYVGNCSKAIDDHIERGEAGIIECVQSTLLSGGVKYSTDITAAHTDGEGSKGDAGISNPKAEFQKILVFKVGNTSVGGNDATMSGIRQNALSEISIENCGERFYFDKPATLDLFLSEDEINTTYQEVEKAFIEALENGYSLKDSKVTIDGINVEFPLCEARAMLKARILGEKGETSGRSRICREDDMNESGVTYCVEGNALQFRNAIDRLIGQDTIPVIVGYKVIAESYGPYVKGDQINPGDDLLQQDKTVNACIPIITLLPGIEGLCEDGTSDLAPGKILTPTLCDYLTLVSAGNQIVGVGDGKRLTDLKYIREVA
jgi:adenylosuccinate synthase